MNMSLLSQQNKARFIKHCVNLPVSVNAKLKQSAVLIPIVTSGNLFLWPPQLTKSVRFGYFYEIGERAWNYERTNELCNYY